MKTNELSIKIHRAIHEIDANLSIKDFSIAVARILKHHYGPHNYEPFISELKLNLELEGESKQATVCEKCGDLGRVNPTLQNPDGERCACTYL